MIPRKAHLWVDYAIIALGILSPWLFGYSDETQQIAITWAFALFALVDLVLTDLPGGKAKLITPKVHRWLDLGSPVLFIGAPALVFSEMESLRTALALMGALFVINTLMTQYQAK